MNLHVKMLEIDVNPYIETILRSAATQPIFYHLKISMKGQSSIQNFGYIMIGKKLKILKIEVWP